MLLECYIYDKRSLESFSGHFYYSPRDRYTGQKKKKKKKKSSLKHQIEFTADLKRRIGEKQYFDYFY